MLSEKEAFLLQQRYYSETAGRYEDAHLQGDPEHRVAMAVLLGYLRQAEIKSVLDVGSGTGRALKEIKAADESIHAIGVEPSEKLRDIGYAQHGLSRDELIGGDALALDYPDDSFDVVCEFGVLHHIARPTIAVREMLRVARKAVFISDCNNFGQGTFLARAFKQMLNGLGLWRAFDSLRTRGRGYHWSEGDGVFYSYSAFSDLGLIREVCDHVHVMNTSGGPINASRNAAHVAVLGVKAAGAI